MTKTYIQPGSTVPLAMPYDRTSGQGLLVGALFGVVSVDALNTVVADVALEGVYDIPKTAALSITAGARVFWDNTNKVANVTSAGQVAIGHAILAAAGADATVRVRLAGNTAAGT